MKYSRITRSSTEMEKQEDKLTVLRRSLFILTLKQEMNTSGNLIIQDHINEPIIRVVNTNIIYPYVGIDIIKGINIIIKIYNLLYNNFNIIIYNSQLIKIANINMIKLENQMNMEDVTNKINSRLKFRLIRLFKTFKDLQKKEKYNISVVLHTILPIELVNIIHEYI